MRPKLQNDLLPILIAAALILTAVWLARSGPAEAASNAAPAFGGSQTALNQAATTEPGNYCQSCHTGDMLDQVRNTATAWKGGPGAAAITSCPGLKTIQEELHYTERMLLAIDRLHLRLPASAGADALGARLETAQQGYLRLLDAPVTSLDAFTGEASTLRYKLGKIYSSLQSQDDVRKRRNVLVAAIVVSLIILASLAWGWYNTRLVKGNPSRVRLSRALGIAVFLTLVAGFFSLPLLRLPEQVTAAADAETQAVQTVLDSAQRAGKAADRAMARAWIMSEVAKAWHEVDPVQAQAVLVEAQTAAEESASASIALWGEAASAQEAAVSDLTSIEKAGLIASEIDAVRGRAWAYRLAAESWSEVDRQQAVDLLALALETAGDGQNLYRDLDLRSIAVVWSRFDPQKAAMILGEVTDPAIRAWGLREVSAVAIDKGILIGALEAARAVADPVQRSLALGRVAWSAQDADVAMEAIAALDSVSGESRAFALAKLAGILKDPQTAEQVAAAYPEAQTLAWLNVGNVSNAREAAGHISDPFERARAQVEIVRLAIDIEPEKAAQMAQQIEIDLLRDRAVRIVIESTKDASQLDAIENLYNRVSALTGLGRLDEAEALAADLKESYPLVRLAQLIGADDPERSLALVEKLQREVDKAEVLIDLAAKSRDPALFERALAIAQAARVRGDALAPIWASLELVHRFITIDPVLAQKALAQALELARKISIK